jgi:hypothetical protein
LSGVGEFHGGLRDSAFELLDECTRFVLAVAGVYSACERSERNPRRFVLAEPNQADGTIVLRLERKTPPREGT